MNKYTRLLFWVVALCASGALIGFASGSGADNDWYQNLAKSYLNPPGYVFGIVWPILYILMALAAAWMFGREDENLRLTKQLFALQMAANYLWSFVFFTWNYKDLAFIWIVFLFGLAAAWVWHLYKHNKALALLQILYLVWLCFAAYLSGTIMVLN